MPLIEPLIAHIKGVHKIKKVLITGSGAVGKTSILTALSKNNFLRDAPNNEYKRTLFINIDNISVTDSKGKMIGHLQVQDLAGQLSLPIHALKDFAMQTLGATDLIFIVFSNDNLQSFLDLQQWFKLINDGLETLKIQPDFILIRNKIDLMNTIDQTLITDLMQMDPRIKEYFELSCVTGEGFDSFYHWLITGVFNGGPR